MKRFLAVLGFCCVSTIAFAQAAPAVDQALSAKLMSEITENVQLRTQLIQAQQQIRDLQEKVAKDMPKDPKKP